MNIKPLVAIHCLVYNHEPYLRDCFEGFVMQQTNFPFVAIVHDDASADNSAAIIREYEQKYPLIFKPIYEIENQWSKHDGILENIMNDAIDASGAKYVAMCEGDDYRCASGYFLEFTAQSIDDIVPIVRNKYQTIVYCLLSAIEYVVLIVLFL